MTQFRNSTAINMTAVLLIIACTVQVAGEQPTAVSTPLNPMAGLQDEIESARDQLNSIPSDSVVAARSDALSAMMTLENWLERGGPEYSAGWKTYLRWDELAAEMEKEDADPRPVRATYERLRQNHQGLELVQFMRLRETLLDYSNLLSLSRIEDDKAYFASLLTQLSEQVATYEAAPSFETAHNIGRIVGILESGRQVPGLVGSVRGRFAQPNVIAWVSEDFLNAGLLTVVDDESPVREVILGTNQTGTAHTTGLVEFRVEPNTERAELVAVMTGTTISENVGRRKLGLRNSLTILSTGTTSVYAEKSIFIGSDGFAPCPSKANCTTSTDIHCISAPELLSGIVTQQVYAKKCQAEQIASRRAERRIEERFDAQVEEAIASQDLGENIDLEGILMRLDSTPQSINASSGSDSLQFVVSQAGPLQLLASRAPNLQQQHDSLDFGLILHESAINNALESILGGKTLSRDRLLSMVGNRSDEAAGDLASQLGDEDWSIRFPATKPILVKFLPNGFEIRITGTRFTRSDQVISDAMEIVASFQVDSAEGGISLSRIGDLKVDYVREGQRSASQVAFRSFAQDKFNLLFPETIESDGFQLPEKMQVTSKMGLGAISFDGDWVQLGWKRLGDTVASAATSEESTLLADSQE